MNYREQRSKSEAELKGRMGKKETLPEPIECQHGDNTYDCLVDCICGHPCCAHTNHSSLKACCAGECTCPNFLPVRNVVIKPFKEPNPADELLKKRQQQVADTIIKPAIENLVERGFLPKLAGPIEVTFEQPPKPAPLYHQQFKCPPTCSDPYCQFCMGGLFSCTVCGAFEGAITQHCPGVMVSMAEWDKVYKGEIDFVDGQWIKGNGSMPCHSKQILIAKAEQQEAPIVPSSPEKEVGGGI